MARRSLRPHLNQIRSWVRQGRTDAWVAHQLEVTVQEIEQFKRQNELAGDEGPAAGAATTVAYPEEIDLRAEDDELIAAELEAAMEAERTKAAMEAERAKADAESDAESEGDEAGARTGPPRRRGRRTDRRSASRSPTRETGPLEGTFDHGEEGYGLWLDPAVQDNPVYAEHWAGHRPVEVTIEEDQIVIRRVGDDD
jgi:hypothetical protein